MMDFDEIREQRAEAQITEFSDCCKAVVNVIDEGIGHFEQGSIRGFHHDFVKVCSECGDYCLAKEGEVDE